LPWMWQRFIAEDRPFPQGWFRSLPTRTGASLSLSGVIQRTCGTRCSSYVVLHQEALECEVRLLSKTIGLPLPALHRIRVGTAGVAWRSTSAESTAHRAIDGSHLRGRGGGDSSGAVDGRSPHYQISDGRSPHYQISDGSSPHYQISDGSSPRHQISRDLSREVCELISRVDATVFNMFGYELRDCTRLQ